jgi:putative spermidine/putrescine transport system permease protein
MNVRPSLGISAPVPRAGYGIPGYVPLALFPLLYVVVVFLAPLVILVGLSFFRYDAGLIVNKFTLENYIKLFTDWFYLRVIYRTLAVSVTVGTLVTVLSYPVAYFLTRTRSRWKPLFVALVLAPELSGVVLRTYGWLVVLEPQGLLNSILLRLGLVEAPLRLVHNYIGITVGLTHVLLTFGILTVMSSLQTVDPTLEQAAQNLGASRVQTFLHVTLPLTLPGILGSFFLAFAIAAGAYATPAILGGKTVEVLATMIYTQLLYIVNWPLASAAAVVLLVIVLVAFVLLGRLGGRREATV